MDPRMRPLNFFLAGCCVGLTAYSAGHVDGVTAVLWGACALTFLAFTVREE